MSPFDVNAKCTKCGFDEISTLFQKADPDRWVYHLGAPDPVKTERREHIRRTCKRCQFAWNEKPLCEDT